MADPADGVELALEELENEPLPTHTREHAPPPEDEVEIDYAEDGLEPQQERPLRLPQRDHSGRPPPASEREIAPQEGIEELRARLQAADTARQQAEERANQAERARAEAGGLVQDANAQFLQSSLDSVRQTMEVLEANLAEAYAMQDFGQAAKINTEIAKVAQREYAIEAGLEQLKNAPRPQYQPQQADQVEQIARQLTPNAAAWIRAHPDYVTDPQKNQRLMAAHYNAMADGVAADSPEYIRYVEDRVLGQRREPEPRNVERRDPVAEQPRRSAPPPAPVSRGNGGAQSNPTRVVLTKEQRDTAHENFPDEMAADPTGRKAEQAYARNMLILQREGRMKVN